MIISIPEKWLLIATILIWGLSLIKGAALYSYYWQLKEYRTDRMQDFLNSPKGRSLLFSPFNLFRVFLVIVFSIAVFEPASKYFSQLVAGTLLFLGLVTLLRFVSNYYNHTFFRPKLTLRMGLILVSVFGIEAFFIFWTKESAITVLILEFFRPILVTIMVFIVGVPFLILKKHLMKKAAVKRKALTNLKVIGITGSFGKSSTKEFLYQILSHKFKTAKTSQHVNVDVGIAQTILKTIDSSHQIFIAEMGAYQIGEIASSCRVAQPNMGILTGVNEQHLSFFGSIENTIQAKGELLAALPKNGVAIVNADSLNAISAMASASSDKIIKYSAAHEADIYASQLSQKGSLLSFNVHWKNEKVHFEVPVLGKHLVQNLLGCIACALELGLSLEEIAEYAKSCQVLDGSLQVFDNSAGVKIVNDSYNSNPDGFVSALSATKSLKPKRIILVTPGMLELGIKSNELHRRVGHRIGEMCDRVIITSEDSFEVLRDTIQEVSPKTTVELVDNHEKLIERISADLLPGDALLFENRTPKHIIEHFKNS